LVEGRRSRCNTEYMCRGALAVLLATGRQFLASPCACNKRWDDLG
jgi:hypothetical protein